MIEYGIKEFSLNPEFMKWIIEELDKVYDKRIKMGEEKVAFS